MRYILTYTLEQDRWEAVDNIIIDSEIHKEETGWRWYDDETRVADILSAYGLDTEQIEYVIDNKLWYVRNCDDVDFYIDENGKLI